MKKKLRDCTYGEVINFCKKQKWCNYCPLFTPKRMLCFETPFYLAKRAPAALDIEIEIHEENE